jgi:hypothetical protein
MTLLGGGDLFVALALTPIEIFPPGILIDFVALRIEVMIELNIFYSFAFLAFFFMGEWLL